MKPCISQACTMPGTFAEDVAHYADAGWQAMEVWLTKLEKHLESHDAGETRRMLADRKMTLAAAAYQGGLLLAQGEERRAHYDHFKRRLDLCQGFGIKTLVLAADFAGTPETIELERAIVSLAEAAQWAAGFGVTLALEFRARNSFCASLDTALALIQHAGQDNVGVCLDFFHYYTGPSKFEDLALLQPGQLAHVHICDVAGVPRELATDSDRVLPGDGDFHIEPMLDIFRQSGYDGYISLELMNQTLWASNPTQVAEIGLTALRKIMKLT